MAMNYIIKTTQDASTDLLAPSSLNTNNTDCISLVMSQEVLLNPKFTKLCYCVPQLSIYRDVNSPRKNKLLCNLEKCNTQIPLLEIHSANSVIKDSKIKKSFRLQHHQLPLKLISFQNKFLFHITLSKTLRTAFREKLDWKMLIYLFPPNYVYIV